MLVLEEEFAKNGYTVVNFDATNSINESDVSSDGPSVLKHYQDLKNAGLTNKKWYYIDSNGIDWWVREDERLKGKSEEEKQKE